jgi:hypothetical protein
MAAVIGNVDDSGPKAHHMTRFEYAAIFYGIVTALSLENVASSFHKLFEASGRVRWHWMAPTNAVGAAIAALGQFWLWWVTRDIRVANPWFLTFLPGATAAILLYLICAAALPDAVPESGINLGDWYFSTRRQFWSLVAIGSLLNACVSAWRMARVDFDARYVQINAPFLIGALAASVIAASMIYVRTWWWHAVGIIVITSGVILLFGSMRL